MGDILLGMSLIMIFSGIVMIFVGLFRTEAVPLQADPTPAILHVAVVRDDTRPATPTPYPDCTMFMQAGTVCMNQPTPTPLPTCPIKGKYLCVHPGRNDYIQRLTELDRTPTPSSSGSLGPGGN